MLFTISIDELSDSIRNILESRLQAAKCFTGPNLFETSLFSAFTPMEFSYPQEIVSRHADAEQKKPNDKTIEECAHDKDFSTALSILVSQQMEEYEYQSRISYINKQSEEETISEQTEEKIDRRIFNGRVAESKLCESLTDPKVMQLMEECHQEVMHRELGHSRYTRMFLTGFTISFYKFVDEKWDTYEGKVAHMHRVVKDRIGEMLEFGVRQLQKGIAWFKSFTKSFHVSEIWAEREERTYVQWSDLKDEIEDFLRVRIPQMVAASTPRMVAVN